MTEWTSEVGSSQGCVYWPYSVVFCCKDIGHQQHFSTKISSAEITEQNTDEHEIKCGLQQLTHGRILYHSALIRAARKGHLQCVERQLEDGQNVNMLGRMNSRDTTALHTAASGGHRDIAKYLLDHGADIHARRAQGSTALHDAARFGYFSVVQLLLENGAYVNLQNDEGETALFLAVSEGKMDGIRWLLESVTDYYHYLGCCYNPDLYPREAIDFLEDKKTEINKMDVSVLESLRSALLRGDLARIRVIVKLNAAVEVTGFEPAVIIRLEMIELLLKRGGDTEIKNVYESSMLDKAVLNKDAKCVQLLLQYGAKVNQFSNVFGVMMTPLHLASSCYGSEELIQSLVGAAANVNCCDSEKHTPLHIAVSNGSIKQVKILLENGADVHILDAKGRTPLHNVRTLDCAKLLVEYGADVKAVTNCGKTVIFTAADKQGEGECIRFLISQGVDPLLRDESGKSAFDVAIQRHYNSEECSFDDGGMECVSVLLQHGAKLDAANINGECLHSAINRKRLGYALALLHHGVPVDVLSMRDKKTALYLATQRNYIAAVKLLLERGADPNIKVYNKTALDIAIAKGYEDCARILIQAGCRTSALIQNILKMQNVSSTYIQLLIRLFPGDINVQDENGIALIHMLCCKLESVDCIETLLASGVDVNITDKVGATCLHILALNSRAVSLICARWMIDKGADINKQDCNGMTPLHYATFNGCVKFARLLLEHGADPSIQDNSGRTAIHVSAGHVGSSSTLLDLFVHHRPTVNARNNEGWTPLHEAVYNGSLECMEKLVGHGANVNAVTDDGFSVLHIAKLQRHKTCVTWLLDIGADRTYATHQRTLRNCLHVQHSALYSSCSGTRLKTSPLLKPILWNYGDH